MNENEPRSPVTSDERAAAIQASVTRIGIELARLVRAFGPPEEVLTHFRAARVEVLKGFRAAIDARIAQLTREKAKGSSVTIE
jgi:hypothetical protein